MGSVGAKIRRVLVPGRIVTRNPGSNLLLLLAIFLEQPANALDSRRVYFAIDVY
jgi:hypothetical protein